VKISVITPVYQPPASVLRECIESVLGQTHGELEFCIVDDGSPTEHVIPILNEYAQADDRIRLALRSTNGGIVAASNDALAMATGEFVALLDHDDMLHRCALERIVNAVAAAPDVDYVYTDEDHLDSAGRRFGAFYKPDWSPERFRSQMYTCHLSALRRNLVEEVGGFHESYDGSQDYDLVLRVTERARNVVHIPEVLYHWRSGEQSTSSNPDAKPWAYVAGVRAVQAHCDRVGIQATVSSTHIPGCHRVRRSLGDPPLVSVIIPTAGTTREVYGLPRTFAVEAVRDLIERTDYPKLEVIVVADRSTPDAVIADLGRIAGDRLKLVWFDGPFNLSEKVNVGSCHASGDLLLLLDDDIQTTSPDWLVVMVSLTQDEDVGVVGARLLFADGTLQHAGHVYVGNPFHTFSGRDPSESGPSGLLQVDRETSGVTAACALVKTSVFRAVGGMTTHLAGNFNDVDFCLKVRHLGYRILWTPHATLFHFESQSCTSTVLTDEIEFLHGRWAEELAHDPYHNPNLMPGRDDWLPRPVDDHSWHSA